MPRLLWPGFTFGAPTAPSSTTTAAAATTDPWTKQSLFAEVWQSRALLLVPRFERVFPSFAAPLPVLGSITTLTYRVSSQFPFLIASGTNVLISSFLTVPT